MPRGKHVNHKGRNRRFTNPEELEEQRKQEEKAKAWRKHTATPSSDDESDDNETKNSDDSEEETDDEDPSKAKGVEGLIAIENPNRVQPKMKKLSTINAEADNPSTPDGSKLTRREREELEKQRAYQHYQKLHAEGKTDEARSDLARLAIIRQQREEAAKKREEEKKEKELAKQSKTIDSLKAIKKR